MLRWWVALFTIGSISQNSIKPSTNFGVQRNSITTSFDEFPNDVAHAREITVRIHSRTKIDIFHFQIRDDLVIFCVYQLRSDIVIIFLSEPYILFWFDFVFYYLTLFSVSLLIFSFLTTNHIVATFSLIIERVFSKL